MSAQLVVLPTAEAMRAHRSAFTALHKEGGMPLVVVIHYLLNLLAIGEPELLHEEELVHGFAMWAMDSRQLTDRLSRQISTPAFSAAFYALYASMQALQELLMTSPKDRQGAFLSGLSYVGWNGDDLMVSKEITCIVNNHDALIRKWG